MKNRFRAVMFLGLWAVAGCAGSSAADDAAIAPPDLSVAVASPDLATPPAPEADLAVNLGPDMSSSCLHFDTWPNVGPQAGFDPQYGVTVVSSLDVKMAPANALSIEDYVSMGEKYPKAVTYSAQDTYSLCEVCTIVAVCDNMGCTDTYFAQGGSVSVTRADRNEKAGEMIATGTNLTLVEWDFSQNGDKPVPGGKCITIGAATFDVKWGATDGGVPDLAMAPRDMAAPLDSKPADMAKVPGDMAGCHPVINEVQATGASASDEWVEIHNGCNGINLTGWRVVYRSAANNNGRSDTTLFTFPKNINTNYILVAGPGYQGNAVADGQWQVAGLAAAGGAVGLVDPNGVLVDSVSYQALSVANDLTEGGGPAPNPPAMQSIERTGFVDTDDNAKDFHISATPTPKAANK